MLWLTPQANEMTEQDWNFPEGRFLVLRARPESMDSAPLYIVMNAAPEAIEFIAAEYSRVQPLDAPPQYGARSHARTKPAGGSEVAGAGALRPGVFGVGMNATCASGRNCIRSA